MSKAQQLYAKLFGEPLEVFPPGVTTKKVIYRVWMWYKQEHGGRIYKNDRNSMIDKLAKQLRNHYKCMQNEDSLVPLANFRTTVIRIVGPGDELNGCGWGLNDPDFLQKKEKWFGEIVTFTKAEAAKNLTFDEVTITSHFSF